MEKHINRDWLKEIMIYQNNEILVNKKNQMRKLFVYWYGMTSEIESLVGMDRYMYNICTYVQVLLIVYA